MFFCDVSLTELGSFFIRPEQILCIFTTFKPWVNVWYQLNRFTTSIPPFEFTTNQSKAWGLVFLLLLVLFRVLCCLLSYGFVLWCCLALSSSGWGSGSWLLCFSFVSVHYENTPIQIYRNFISKNWKRWGGSNNLCFRAKIRKVMCNPVNQSFTM